MQNTSNDYFAVLRSDYIAPKKNNYDNDRRPFNRDNAGEFQLIPVVVYPHPAPVGIKLAGVKAL